jgi:hypothetical protein
LLLLAMPHNTWVESQARIVEKHPAVDLPYVDTRRRTRTNGPHSPFQIERDAEVFGKMVQRAERQDAERRFRPNEGRGNSVDCAIPTPGNNDPAAPAHRLIRQFADLCPTAGKRNTGMQALAGADISQALLYRLVCGGSGSRQGIQDDVYQRGHLLTLPQRLGWRSPPPQENIR